MSENQKNNKKSQDHNKNLCEMATNEETKKNDQNAMKNSSVAELIDTFNALAVENNEETNKNNAEQKNNDDEAAKEKEDSLGIQLLDELLSNLSLGQLEKKSGQTALFYHPDCLKHEPKEELVYECPERCLTSYQMLNDHGIMPHLKQIEVREATERELAMSHKASHIEQLKSNKDKDGWYDSDTYYCADSYRAALLAAGSCIDLMLGIMSKKYQNGFALVRPPGHHCEKGKAMGFCLLNNAVIASKECLFKMHPNARILIIDWDAHHGNGTQNMLYDNHQIIYFSVHRHDNGSFYPAKECGKGKAKECGNGFNINVPLNVSTPGNGHGDREYLLIWRDVLLPICREFKPDIILISAGFDASIGDPLGGMRVTPPCYGLLTRLLLNECSQIGVILEGGYNLETMPRAICCVNYALMKGQKKQKNEFDVNEFEEEFLSFINEKEKFEEWKKKYGKLLGDEDYGLRLRNRDINKTQFTVYESCKQSIKEVLTHQQKYWKCAKEILQKYNLELDELLSNLSLGQLEKKSGQTALFYHPDCLKHEPKEELVYECPERCLISYQMLSDHGIISHLKQIEVREATEKELMCHKAIHIEQLKSNKDKDGWYDSDTYYCPDSYRAALLAAGSCIDLMLGIMSKKYQNGFALVRPPGHHCEEDKAMGFCLLNNAVIASKECLRQNPNSHILIIDWDAHHGNGTQNMLYDNDQIIYFSVHRHDNGTFYPSEECGKGKAKECGNGFNVNVPLNVSTPGNGHGDREYLLIWRDVLLPICREFKPDIILISAGFDASIGDPLGGMRVTPPCYGLMTRLLLNECSQIGVILEGGYNLETMPRAICCVNYALMNGQKKQKNEFDVNEFEEEFLSFIDEKEKFEQWKKKYGKLLNDEPYGLRLRNRDVNKTQFTVYESCKQSIKEVLTHQQNYWKCAKEILQKYNLEHYVL